MCSLSHFANDFSDHISSCWMYSKHKDTHYSIKPNTQPFWTIKHELSAGLSWLRNAARHLSFPLEVNALLCFNPVQTTDILLLLDASHCRSRINEKIISDPKSKQWCSLRRKSKTLPSCQPGNVLEDSSVSTWFECIDHTGLVAFVLVERKCISIIWLCNNYLSVDVVQEQQT